MASPDRRATTRVSFDERGPPLTIELSKRKLEPAALSRLPPSVTCLDLTRCALASLAPLASLRALELLNVSYNRLRNLDHLGGLSALKLIYARSNTIGQLRSLAGVPRLHTLDLECNSISSVGALAPLHGLIELSDLRLRGNPVSEAAYRRSLRANMPHLGTLDGRTLKEEPAPPPDSPRDADEEAVSVARREIVEAQHAIRQAQSARRSAEKLGSPRDADPEAVLRSPLVLAGGSSTPPADALCTPPSTPVSVSACETAVQVSPSVERQTPAEGRFRLAAAPLSSPDEFARYEREIAEAEARHQRDLADAVRGGASQITSLVSTVQQADELLAKSAEEQMELSRLVEEERSRRREAEATVSAADEAMRDALERAARAEAAAARGAASAALSAARPSPSHRPPAPPSATEADAATDAPPSHETMALVRLRAEAEVSRVASECARVRLETSRAIAERDAARAAAIAAEESAAAQQRARQEADEVARVAQKHARQAQTRLAVAEQELQAAQGEGNALREGNLERVAELERLLAERTASERRVLHQLAEVEAQRDNFGAAAERAENVLTAVRAELKQAEASRVAAESRESDARAQLASQISALALIRQEAAHREVTSARDDRVPGVDDSLALECQEAMRRATDEEARREAAERARDAVESRAGALERELHEMRLAHSRQLQAASASSSGVERRLEAAIADARRAEEVAVERAEQLSASLERELKAAKLDLVTAQAEARSAHQAASDKLSTAEAAHATELEAMRALLSETQAARDSADRLTDHATDEAARALESLKEQVAREEHAGSEVRSLSEELSRKRAEIEAAQATAEAAQRDAKLEHERAQAALKDAAEARRALHLAEEARDEADRRVQHDCDEAEARVRAERECSALRLELQEQHETTSRLSSRLAEAEERALRDRRRAEDKDFASAEAEARAKHAATRLEELGGELHIAREALTEARTREERRVSAHIEEKSALNAEVGMFKAKLIDTSSEAETAKVELEALRKSLQRERIARARFDDAAAELTATSGTSMRNKHAEMHLKRLAHASLEDVAERLEMAGVDVSPRTPSSSSRSGRAGSGSSSHGLALRLLTGELKAVESQWRSTLVEAAKWRAAAEEAELHTEQAQADVRAEVTARASERELSHKAAVQLQMLNAQMSRLGLERSQMGEMLRVARQQLEVAHVELRSRDELLLRLRRDEPNPRELASELKALELLLK